MARLGASVAPIQAGTISKPISPRYRHRLANIPAGEQTEQIILQRVDGRDRKTPDGSVSYRPSTDGRSYKEWAKNMSSYDLIKDLEKKLTLFRDTHTWRVASPNPIHEKIARYLHVAEIYPRRLDRRNVTAFLEGRESWPTVQGAEFCIAYRVDVCELERARVIRFSTDDLIVHSTVSPSPDMPIKLRHQLNALNFLYDLKYLETDVAPVQIRLDKSVVDLSDLPFLQDTLIPQGERFRLKVKREDVTGVGTYFWKQLIKASTDPDEAFAQYVTKMKLAVGRLHVFDIDFELDVDIQQYLTCAYNYISSDTSLLESWEQAAADVAINHHRIDGIIKKHTPRVIRITQGEPHEVVQQPEPFCEALDLSQLDSMIFNLASKVPASLFERAEWWKDVTRYRSWGQSTISECLLHVIIRNEDNIYNPEDSFPITRKLIEFSSRSPKLSGALFSNINHPPFICYLLSNPDTNHLGLISIYLTLERSLRPVSDHVPYEKTWSNLIWDQSTEVFYTSYLQYQNSEALPDAVFRLYEMMSWFAAHEIGYNSRGRTLAETRLPSLKDAISAIVYRNESGQIRPLAADHCLLFSNTAKQYLTKTHKINDSFPLGVWLILFWCIDWDNNTPKSHDDADHPACEILIDSYLELLQRRLMGGTNAVDDPLAFDELDWHKAYTRASPGLREKWISTLDDHTPVQAGETSQEIRDSVYAIRMHSRLLLKLYSQSKESGEKALLASKIISIVERFGFHPDEHPGIFDYSHDNSDFSPVNLWRDLCTAANSFTPVQFKRLIDALRIASAPLVALFVLLERTASFGNKKRVLKLISDRSQKEASSNWTPEAFDIILKSANNGQMRIAREYLEFVREHAHKTYKNKTTEISAKLDLKDIFDNAELTDAKKIDQLRSYEIRSDERQVFLEIDSFKRYLIATLTTNIDHAKALGMFESVLNVEPTLQNATGLIKVVLSWPSTLALPATLEHYLSQWIQIYESTFESDLKAKLSDAELSYVLQICMATNRLDDFKRFWNVASQPQRLAYELAPPRADYLKRTKGSLAALAYIQELREFHQHLPSDADEMLFSLEANLKKYGALVASKPQPSSTPEIDSLHNRLRHAWLSIKDLNAYDQSQIFMAPTESIDDYLFELVEQVGLELLKRNGNLQRKKPGTISSSTISLDEEDMINDWFVSLVSHRMNFAGWTMLDQSRVGRSGSGKGVGETDGWVKDGRGKPVFLFEGFRLGNHIKKETIAEHLNKLSSYNSAGMSPIFVVVYAASDDFPKLCRSYKEYVDSIDYDGFDHTPRSGLKLKSAPVTSANARYFEETRRINENDVRIYHHLLHLKPPL
jgi:hypothetical protein